MARLGPRDGKLHPLRRRPHRSRDGALPRQISIAIEAENESAQMSKPSIISQRPIPTPEEPSTHRSRSQSPIRNLRTLLAAAMPAIHCKQVSETILPEYVSKLKRNLLQAGEKGVIAEQLKASIIPKR